MQVFDNSITSTGKNGSTYEYYSYLCTTQLNNNNLHARETYYS